MTRKRYSDEQIAFALRQAENGTTVEEVCRKLGVSEATFYRWKQQFAGMGVVGIRRLKQLEEENVKLKRLVADLSLDKTMLQDVLRRKFCRPAVRRNSSSSGLRCQRAAGLQNNRVRAVIAALPIAARSTDGAAHPAGRADISTGPAAGAEAGVLLDQTAIGWRA